MWIGNMPRCKICSSTEKCIGKRENGLCTDFRKESSRHLKIGNIPNTSRREKRIDLGDEHLELFCRKAIEKKMSRNSIEALLSFEMKKILNYELNISERKAFGAQSLLRLLKNS